MTCLPSGEKSVDRQEVEIPLLHFCVHEPAAYNRMVAPPPSHPSQIAICLPSGDQSTALTAPLGDDSDLTVDQVVVSTT